MLPKLNRLPAFEFPKLLRRGQRARVSTLELTYAKNSLPLSRFGIITSVKVDKRSTIRNRIKRLLRESVHGLLPQVLPGYDIALVVKQIPSPLTYQNVSQVVKELLAKTNLLYSP